MYDSRRPSLPRQAVALVKNVKSRVVVFPALVGVITPQALARLLKTNVELS